MLHLQIQCGQNLGQAGSGEDPSVRLQSRCCNLATQRLRFEFATPSTGRGRLLRKKKNSLRCARVAPGSRNFSKRNSGSTSRNLIHDLGDDLIGSDTFRLGLKIKDKAMAQRWVN